IKNDGINAAMLFGEVPQNHRTRTLDRCIDVHVRVLLVTDVARRGIHIVGVYHLVNIILPVDLEDYVHRFGHTGSSCIRGIAISFACEDDAFLLPELEKAIEMKLNITYPSESLLTPVANLRNREPRSGRRRKRPTRRRNSSQRNKQNASSSPKSSE